MAFAGLVAHLSASHAGPLECLVARLALLSAPALFLFFTKSFTKRNRVISFYCWALLPAAPARPPEEEIYDDPWKILVACMLLNKTTAAQVGGAGRGGRGRGSVRPGRAGQRAAEEKGVGPGTGWPAPPRGWPTLPTPCTPPAANSGFRVFFSHYSTLQALTSTESARLMGLC